MRNQKVWFDGYCFDSKAEKLRYTYLRSEKNIRDLVVHPRFVLLEQSKPNGYMIRKIAYYADFMYTRDGCLIVEDVKGIRTLHYRIKAKFFIAYHAVPKNIRFQEVCAKTMKEKIIYSPE